MAMTCSSTTNSRPASIRWPHNCLAAYGSPRCCNVAVRRVGMAPATMINAPEPEMTARAMEIVLRIETIVVDRKVAADLRDARDPISEVGRMVVGDGALGGRLHAAKADLPVDRDSQGRRCSRPSTGMATAVFPGTRWNSRRVR